MFMIRSRFWSAISATVVSGGLLLAAAGPASATTAAERAQATCDGYVHSSQFSYTTIAVKSSDTPWVFLAPGNTWYGDHPVEFMLISIPGKGGYIEYYRNNEFIRTDEVGGGVYTVNPCDEAWVMTK
jgi:hypothetical protein